MVDDCFDGANHFLKKKKDVRSHHVKETILAASERQEEMGLILLPGRREGFESDIAVLVRPSLAFYPANFAVSAMEMALRMSSRKSGCSIALPLISPSLLVSISSSLFFGFLCVSIRTGRKIRRRRLLGKAYATLLFKIASLVLLSLEPTRVPAKTFPASIPSLFSLVGCCLPPPPPSSLLVLTDFQARGQFGIGPETFSISPRFVWAGIP